LHPQLLHPLDIACGSAVAVAGANTNSAARRHPPTADLFMMSSSWIEFLVTVKTEPEKTGTDFYLEAIFLEKNRSVH